MSDESAIEWLQAAEVPSYMDDSDFGRLRSAILELDKRLRDLEPGVVQDDEGNISSS